MRLALVAALSGGLNGAANSTMITWTNPLAGLPDSVTANVVTCAITGLMSGFMGAFIGVVSYRRKAHKAALATVAHGTDHPGAPVGADKSKGRHRRATSKIPFRGIGSPSRGRAHTAHLPVPADTTQTSHDPPGPPDMVTLGSRSSGRVVRPDDDT